MGRYQFMHIEGYARHAPKKSKAGNHSIRSIMAEAMREEGAHPHVDAPLPPVILFGKELSDVEADAVDWADQSTDLIGRKLRKDGLALLAGVISCPPEMSVEEWDAYKLDSVVWLAKDPRLVSVIEHKDETQKHIHFFKIALPGERFEAVHPGRKASLAAAALGKVKGDQNKAYKAAMRAYQTDFYESVGVRHGISRIGPGRRRLTRVSWVAEQQTSMLISQALKSAEINTVEGARILFEANAAARVSLEAADLKQVELAAEAKKVEASFKAAAEAMAVSKKAQENNLKTVAFLKGQKAEIKAGWIALETAKKQLEGVGRRAGVVIGTLTKAVGVITMAVPKMWQEMRWKKAAEIGEKKVLELSNQLRHEGEKRADAEADAVRSRLQRDVAIERTNKLSKDTTTATKSAPDFGQKPPKRPR